MSDFDFGELMQRLISGTEVMLRVAFGSWLIAIAFGLLLALLLRSNARLLRATVDFLGVVLRGTPELLFIYLLFYALSGAAIRLDGIASVTLALGTIYAAFAAEIYRAGFAIVPRSQRDAAESLGLSSRQIMIRVILPQATRFTIVPLTNLLLGLMKLATYASAVGVAEIVYQGRAYILLTGAVVPVAIGIAIVYLALSLPATYLLRRVEARLERGYRLAAAA